MRQRFLFLAASTLAAGMDFGIGMAIASLVTNWFGTHAPWYVLGIGGVLALLPDFDLIPSVIRCASPTFDHHQSPFHRPLLVLPISILIAYLFFGQMWAVITGICVLAHYIHDTNFISNTYGIAWFWPFSDLYWSPHGLFISSGNTSHTDWLQANWLQPSILSIREITTGLLGVSIALYQSNISVLVICKILLVVKW